MKDDTTFSTIAVRGDHLEDSKVSKKAPHTVKFKSVPDCHRQKRVLQNKGRWADL